MNENLQKALAEILESALAAKDFMVSETPEVIQQLLTYNFTMSIIQTVCGIIMLFLLIPMWKKAIKYVNNDSLGDAIDVYAPVGLISVCIGAPGSMLLFNLTWLKIWLAPKVYLIEYMANLVKDNT